MITKPLRCVVLEDDDSIREWVVNHLKSFSELEIVGEAATENDAFHLIAHTKPDAAFMDIDLIGGNAFTLMSRLQQNALPIPFVVLATGFPQHALKALNDYRVYVVRYVLKPFVDNWDEKFREAIDALIAAKINGTNKANLPPVIDTNNEPENTNTSNSSKSIFLNVKGKLIRIDFDKTTYLEAAGGGHSIVVEDEGNHQVDMTLRKFLKVLPHNFFRISKSNVINLDRVISINRGERTVELRESTKTKSLGVSDTFYNDLLNRLPMVKDRL